MIGTCQIAKYDYALHALMYGGGGGILRPGGYLSPPPGDLTPAPDISRRPRLSDAPPCVSCSPGRGLGRSPARCGLRDARG
jgi:hypothetical protein